MRAVRDIYEIPGSSNLLFVATDRVSCYDVVLKNGIPTKGSILTEMSTHWLGVLRSALPSLRTHFINLDLPPEIQDPAVLRAYRSRSTQVRRLEIFPIESIVRGYISGSAWESYKKDGTVNGIRMPAGLQESQKLESPIWTPSTKAPPGGKDENISAEKAREILGPYAAEIERLSLEIFSTAHAYALERGIILADTKFEFGRDPTTSGPEDKPVLVDEVLTPDSSRFWLASAYAVGQSQQSLDKQYLRDWLVSSGLKGKEDVEIPQDVVQKTAKRYQTAFKMICGRDWNEEA